MQNFLLKPPIGLAVLITFIIPGVIWVLAFNSQVGKDATPAPDPTLVSNQKGPATYTDGLSVPGSGVWQTFPSGSKYLDIASGTGPSPMVGQQISLIYTARLENGKVIASSRFDTRENSLELLTYVFGYTPFPAGWTEAVSTMKVGGWRRFVLPHGTAYGSTTLGGLLPADSTVVVDVQLVYLDPTILPRDTRR